MEYIAHRRFKKKALFGEANISAFSKCEEKEGTLYFSDRPVCFVTSENAHQYFARNDDGHGTLRGKLTQSIQKCLSERDDQYQERWDKIWADPICQKYILLLL